MLEAHIMQAQAAAMAADERELQRMSEGYENYHVLGLPPGTILFNSVLYSVRALSCQWPIQTSRSGQGGEGVGGGSGHPEPTILKIKVFLKWWISYKGTVEWRNKCKEDLCNLRCKICSCKKKIFQAFFLQVPHKLGLKLWWSPLHLHCISSFCVSSMKFISIFIISRPLLLRILLLESLSKYGKWQTSDSSWEFLKIENEQIKTA